MTLLDLFHLTRRNLLLIAACMLGGVLVAAGYSALQPKMYTATASGYVVAASGGSVSGAYTGDTLAAARAKRYLPLASTTAVTERIAEELDGTGIAPTGISASIVSDSNIMQITAAGSSSEQAKAVADAGVKAMAAEIHRMETLDPAGITSGDATSVDDIPTTGTAAIALVPFQEAGAPGAATSPNWRLNLLIGLAAGLLIGFAAAFARKVLDVRVRTTKDMERLTDKGVLGIIPVASGLSKRSKTRRKSAKTALAQEALRQLRTNLRYVSVDDPPRSIVVTSANPGEGKSTVAANLARVLAAGGQPTVLVDADLRRPALHKEFDLDSGVGLSQVLVGDVVLRDALQATETDLLQVLPAGRIPPNPSELLGSKQMAKLIAALATNRTVIIDAPPILPVSDAGLLTAAADGALLVVRTGKTLRDQISVAVKRLDQVGGRLLGSTLNLTSPRRLGETMYGYGRGYGYARKSYGAYYGSNSKVAGEGTLLAPHVPQRVSEAAPVAAPSAVSPGRRAATPTGH